MKILDIKLRALERKTEEVEHAEALLCKEIQKHSDLEIGIQSLGGDGYGVYSPTIDDGGALTGIQSAIDAIKRDGRLTRANFKECL